MKIYANTKCRFAYSAIVSPNSVSQSCFLNFTKWLNTSLTSIIKGIFLVRMASQLPCLDGTLTTIVNGNHIYFPKETHFSVRRLDRGYIVRTSANGHKCCQYSARNGEMKIINTSYDGGIQIYDNVLLPMSATEKINIP